MPGDQRPKYERIANLLREAIRSGEYGPGDQLPSEKDLMVTHEVARMTARQALAVLRTEGLTSTRRGAGVFVRHDIHLNDLGHARVEEALGKPPVAPTTTAREAPGPTQGETVIFGSGEALPAHVSTDAVRVRQLEPDEIRSLTPDQLVYVDDGHFDPPILVPAHIQKGNNKAYLESSVPSAPVQSIYGSSFHARFDDIFEADDLGEEMSVIRPIGSRASGAFFFLGIEPGDVEERIRKALRDEFGPGVVEVWNLRSGPVRDVRWDIYHTRTDWVPKEGSRKGKNQEGSYEIVEKRLIRRGIRDGHQNYFMGGAPTGWQVVSEIHQPDTLETEVL